MKVNDLSGLTDAQYRALLTSRPDPEFRTPTLGKKATAPRQSMNRRPHQRTIGYNTELDEGELGVKAVNWVTKEQGKYMTPVKNQGTCGSCWAFAGVAVVESRVAIAQNRAAVPLSVEQVLSCSRALARVPSKFDDKMTSSSNGCLGGMPFLTYAYLHLRPPHGIACAHDYPYAMATNETRPVCRAEAVDVAVAWQATRSDYHVVASTERAVLQAVMTGPVTANMDAESDGFRHYGGGIYDAQDCRDDGNEVNHAVVIVGFGETMQGQKYWVLRNTWGTMWGEDGYMRIARGSHGGDYGPCNLYLYVDYPVNLTFAPHATTCAAPATKLTPLPFHTLLALSTDQLLLLTLCTVVTVATGLGLYYGTEWRYHWKEARGDVQGGEAIARWIVPSRDQLATALRRRNARE